MLALTLREICLAVNGTARADENITVTGVSTDTRTISPGTLFVAIRGDRFDGHAFARDALSKGAVLVLAQENASLDDDIPAVFVPDTVEALGKLAAYHRSRFDIPVVAVTGSVGKTSTKEMIASVLSVRFKVHKTKGNQNNEIGLPLSVLELDQHHEAAVFELGMRGFGEIAYLSRIIKPDFAVITNIGLSHIERLGSRQNILKAKLEILEGLSEKGTIVLNGDDELLSGLSGLLSKPAVFYGIREESELYAYDLVSHGESGVEFKIKINSKEMQFFVPAPGMHNVENALASLAVAVRLGMQEEEIRSGLLQFAGERMRMAVIERNGIKVINDTYNAAPDSISAALYVLADIGKNKRKWAILGDMLELGEWTERSHKEIGRQVAESNIDFLVAVGDYAKWYAEGAKLSGMPLESTLWMESAGQAYDYIRERMETGDVMLFKGSRKMGLDALVERLFPM